MPRGVYARKPKKKKVEEKPVETPEATEFKRFVPGTAHGILKNREKNIKKFYKTE